MPSSTPRPDGTSHCQELSSGLPASTAPVTLTKVPSKANLAKKPCSSWSTLFSLRQNRAEIKLRFHVLKIQGQWWLVSPQVAADRHREPCPCIGSWLLEQPLLLPNCGLIPEQRRGVDLIGQAEQRHLLTRLPMNPGNPVIPGVPTTPGCPGKPGVPGTPMSPLTPLM